MNEGSPDLPPRPPRSLTLNPFKVFLLVVVCGFLSSIVLWRTAIYDDAYITFRYARNVARGLGPIFNIGERVEGCTTFLQMMVLAPFSAWGFNLSYVSVVLSFLCLALVAVAGYRKIAAAPASSYNINWSWLYALVMATNPAVIHWALSGMETIWFMTAITIAVLLTERDMDRGRWPIGSMIACLLAALIRPEGTTLAAALVLSWLWFYRPRPIWRTVAACLLFGATYGAYFAWRYSYYGYLFPNTYYAKVDGMSPALVFRGLFYVIRNIVWAVFPLTAAVLFYRVRKSRLPLLRWEKVSLLVVAAFLLQAALSGGDFMPYFRFIMPVWPLTVLLTWSLLARIMIGETGSFLRFRLILKRLATEKIRPRILVKYVVLLNILMLFLGVNEFKVLLGKGIVRGMEDSARFLDEILPQDALVASLAIGAMGYFLDRPLIDIVGLTDEHIAHADIKIGRGTAGHEKYDAPYLLSRRPDFILICFQDDETPSGECKSAQKKYVLPPLESLYESAEFQQKYAYCSYKIEKGRFPESRRRGRRGEYFSTFMRRDRQGQPGYEGWVCPH